MDKPLSDIVLGKNAIVASLLFSVMMFVIGLINLHNPALLYFDEVHYVPAAKRLMLLQSLENREHPPLSKEIIALSMYLIGDNPLGWRFSNLLCGSLSIFFFSRSLWNLTHSRIITVLFSMLLVTNFLLFVLSRTALLEAPMLMFVGLASWLFLLSLNDSQSREMLRALSGIAIGLAIACKWSAVPVFLSMVFAFAWLNRHSPRSLAKGIVYFGVLPVLAYFSTFVPAFFVRTNPLTLSELVPLQFAMKTRLGLFVYHHPYESRWWQWPLNMGPMWFLRGDFQGAYRNILVGQNPLSAIAAMPAMVYGAWLWVRRQDWQIGAVLLPYAACLAFWVATAKPVQFVYHYLIASTFALAILATLLGRAWEKNQRWPAVAIIAGSTALFAWFYPALSAMPLPDKRAESRFTWLPGWQPVDSMKNYLKASPQTRAALDRSDKCLQEPLRDC